VDGLDRLAMAKMVGADESIIDDRSGQSHESKFLQFKSSPHKPTKPSSTVSFHAPAAAFSSASASIQNLPNAAAMGALR
jgi:hypothetical protein